MEIVGIKESKGVYEGNEYHNFVLQLTQPFDSTYGYGLQVDFAKIKAVDFLPLLEEVGGLMQDLIGRQVNLMYDKYGKVVKVVFI